MAAVHATIAHQPYDLTRERVEDAMSGVAPESIQAHYAIVGGRRFPPKQVIAAVTGLDRSAFISTQARRILERLGFTVGRVGSPPRGAGPPVGLSSAADERLAREAELLRPYMGQFVAVDPDWTEVVVSGPDPTAVSRALRAIGRAGVIFRVPLDPSHDIGGFAW
ncbi:SCO5918 family protein [Iamia sp.]|uniref:SCO5918 family protein n=1 Tax=Iamia sp. TaxID=2722710 RepID=UPI002BC26221|nr:SCO5918 family protein [Iamia sp.]HXH59564.1 SCO5918 family protein [Iamia sp.]